MFPSRFAGNDSVQQTEYISVQRSGEKSCDPDAER